VDKVGVLNSAHNEHKLSKLERIKVWTDSTHILDLPFSANFDTTTEGTFRVKFWELDSIFRKDFRKAGGDVYLMGLLSDTTNFYGFIFISIAGVGNPGIVTFDKSGNNVDLKLLTKGNCVIYAGDILLCKEYTTIGKDWSLNYYYKSVVVTEFFESRLDTICSQQIQHGQVSKSGIIELAEIKEIDCSEL
jgi:hypothetical protein